VRRIFFTSNEVSSPSGETFLPSVGTSQQKRGVYARARAGPPRAAVSDHVGGGERGGGEQTFAADPVSSPVLDRLASEFESIHRRPARFSHRRWGDRLDRALRRLDRYADLGQGRAGYGLELALELIRGEPEAWADVEADPPVSSPASLAYFVPVLDAVSKSYRRAFKPRIKAERRRKRAAAHQGPPHESPGEPGGR
jgi:hypothetical protein